MNAATLLGNFLLVRDRARQNPQGIDGARIRASKACQAILVPAAGNLHTILVDLWHMSAHVGVVTVASHAVMQYVVVTTRPE